MSFLGVLMLQTRFPRVAGDVGHAASFAMPVRYRVVPGASAQRAVREGDVSLLAPFIAAAQGLVDEGASAITTSCGFLVQFQQAMQDALAVPVWTSSLLQLRELHRPGVLTVDAASLSAGHLAAANAPPDTPVAGLRPGCHLQRVLLDDLPELDTALAERDVVDAALHLQAQHPRIACIVFECTNLPPYAQAVQRATGLPVHHLMSFVHQRWQALCLD